MSEWEIKHPEAWVSVAFNRIEDTLRAAGPGNRNVALRAAGFRWGRIRHIANGSADTYDATLGQIALEIGLTKKEAQQTLARAIRDGQTQRTEHRIAADASHDSGPKLRIRRSAVDPTDDPPEAFDLSAPRRTTSEDARAIWNAARDFLGTPAEQYLRARGLNPEHIAADVRYSRSAEHHYCIFPVTDAAGHVVAVQRVSITVAGDPVMVDGRKRKMTVGPSGDGAFVAMTGDGPEIVCEGSEDALSIAAALMAEGRQATVCAALASPQRLIKPGCIVFADADGSLEAVEAKAREVGALLCKPEAPLKDANDVWRARGGAAVLALLDAAQEPRPLFQSWEVMDPAALPPRDFIYGQHYIRRFASLTVAPGGLGKSLLALAEMIAIATGRPILGVQPAERQKVVYYNAEDPLDEIKRRVLAICQHHGIDQKELVGWLHIASGREIDLILASGEAGEIVEAAFQAVTNWHQKVGAAVYCFDPLANMTESPETNDVFRRLGKRMSRLADDLDCAIDVVHHTRKLGGREAEVEDSRGGGALVGAVRAARALNPMTADEAAKAGLETHIDHFRIEAGGKNNLARSPAKATWFRRVSVELPNGDYVASLEPWEWPDAFDGVTNDQARACRIAVQEADPRPRQNVQARDWVGRVIAPILKLDADDKADKARLGAIIRQWIKSDVLAIETIYSARDGRDVPFVVAGKNDMSEGRT